MIQAFRDLPLRRGTLEEVLMDYKARLYDSNTGRFIQPDTDVPARQGPQALNRYAYGLGNPVRFTDPTGHASIGPADGEIPVIVALVIAGLLYVADNSRRHGVGERGCSDSLSECFRQNATKSFRDQQRIEQGEFEDMLDSIYQDLNRKLRTSFDPARADYDTPFFDGNPRVGPPNHPDSTVCIESTCSPQSAINYVAQGMYSARTGQSVSAATRLVQYWNKLNYGHDASDDELYWLKYGYDAYERREQKTAVRVQTDLLQRRLDRVQ